ncbi:helix-turn-helix domain-containing protein [Candidatus Margulisiibacteriota bacterium]
MSKNKLKKLKLRQVSESIKKGVLYDANLIGLRLKEIRAALGMTQKQLAKRLGVDPSVVSKIEERAGNCNLKTLLKLVTALQCKIKIAVVAGASLESIVKNQAKKAAKKILDRTYSNMALEKQAPRKSAYRYQFKEIVEDLCNNPGPELWEE